MPLEDYAQQRVIPSYRHMLHEIEKPYLLLTGDTDDRTAAKTAFGLRDWVPQHCLGQLRFNERAIDLGLPELSPTQAVAAGARTLVIGIAPQGGRLPRAWHATILDALRAGLDVAAGLHQRLADLPEIQACAAQHGRKLHDVRHSTTRFDIGTGKRRPGRRLLTVGTDCALGKKYTALAIARGLDRAGRACDFRATGQTGILIAGRGIAIDAVVADFISGAAETLSPANAPDHWDVIEGQGALFHPAYAGVTLGLVHGSQPDALVLCHQPERTTLSGYPHVPIVPLQQAINSYLWAAHMTNPGARFVGVSLNTAGLSDERAEEALNHAARETGLPCVDPIRTGVAPIVAALAATFP